MPSPTPPRLNAPSSPQRPPGDASTEHQRMVVAKYELIKRTIEAKRAAHAEAKLTEGTVEVQAELTVQEELFEAKLVVYESVKVFIAAKHAAQEEDKVLQAKSFVSEMFIIEAKDEWSLTVEETNGLYNHFERLAGSCRAFECQELGHVSLTYLQFEREVRAGGTPKARAMDALFLDLTTEAIGAGSDTTSQERSAATFNPTSPPSATSNMIRPFAAKVTIGDDVSFECSGSTMAEVNEMMDTVGLKVLRELQSTRAFHETESTKRAAFHETESAKRAAFHETESAKRAALVEDTKRMAEAEKTKREDHSASIEVSKVALEAKKIELERLKSTHTPQRLDLPQEDEVSMLHSKPSTRSHSVKAKATSGDDVPLTHSKATTKGGKLKKQRQL